MIWHGTLYVVLSLAEMDNYSSIITNCISKHPLKCLYVYLCKCMMYTCVNVCTVIYVIAGLIMFIYVINM